MDEVGFLIIATPNGKHRLRQRIDGVELDRGLFDTHDLAVEGIERILKPKTTYFNKDGKLLHDVPANQN